MFFTDVNELRKEIKFLTFGKGALSIGLVSYEKSLVCLNIDSHYTP